MTTADSTLRVRIAEAQGYTFKDEGWRYPNEPDWQKYKAVYRGDGFIGLARPDWISVPDYLNDLNACAQFEAGLTDEQYQKYHRNLWHYCGAHRLTSATARQRCLAYLAMINPQKPL